MPLEAPPERGALWLENWVLSATIASVTSQQVNFPATHLLNPHRSDNCLSVNATSDWLIVFDLGTPRLPMCLGIVGANFDGGANFALRGGSDSGLATGAVRWDFPLYTQDPTGKMLKFYLGSPTSGSAVARRFWGIHLSALTWGSYNTPEDFFDLAVVWLGEYTNIRPWEGTRVRAKDPSMRSLSYGRAPWSDPLTPYREADVRLGGLTPAQGYDLESKIRAQGTKHAVLDIHAFSTDPILKRGGALYGQFPEDSCDFSLSSPEDNSLDFAFEETSG